MAIKAITEALAELPRGTLRWKLEQARDKALDPFKAAVEKSLGFRHLKDRL